jgi:hypothetical protein
VERINSLNYQLIKQIEFLRSKPDPVERSNDLQIKLSIVLAENEKLNELIERFSKADTPREAKIEALAEDVSLWRDRCIQMEGRAIKAEKQLRE